MGSPQPELRLPPELLAKASLAGGERAWRRSDLPQVFAAAQAAALANLGGEVQFRLPDGTCELYWQSFDATDRRAGESWDQFVSRSRAEVERTLARLPTDRELVSDGVRSFEFLAEKASNGADLEGALWFVCDFVSEDDWDRLSAIAKRFPYRR